MADDRQHAGKRGFTLVEILAALAIASVVILATTTLLHNLALSFDRGANRVTNGERLSLAAERLATDIGSARFATQTAANGGTVLFRGQAKRLMFIGSPGLDAASRAKTARPAEVVSLTVEANGDATEIVRRRGTWPGLHTPFESVTLADPVVLLAGSFDATFKFGRTTPDGALTWVDSWANERTLPHLVKLSLRDRAGGGDLLGGAEFVIHADAAAACARSDATADCLSNSATGTAQGAAAGSQQAQKTAQ